MKNRFKFLLLFGAYLLSITFSIAGDVNDEVKDKKVYSEEEFQKKVEQEVVRKLAKVSGESLKDFAKSLLDKEKAIDQQNEDIAKRKQELSIIEKNLQKKIKEFRAQQDRVIGCVDENEKESSGRIDHIVKVISGMKPANAAEVLAVQDSGISVQIISKLNPEKVSKIFNLMDKEISARLQKSYINMKR